MSESTQLTVGQARILKAVMSGLFRVNDTDRPTILRRIGLDSADLEWAQGKGYVAYDSDGYDARMKLTEEGTLALLGSVDAGTIEMRDPNDRIWMSVILSQARNGAASSQLTIDLSQALRSALDRLDKAEDLARLAAEKLDRLFGYAWSIEQERDAALAAGHLTVNPKSYPEGFESAYAYDYKTELGSLDLLRNQGLITDSINHGDDIPLPGLRSALPVNTAVAFYDHPAKTVTLAVERKEDLRAILTTLPIDPLRGMAPPRSSQTDEERRNEELIRQCGGYKSYCPDLDCLNYEGAMYDCHEAVRQMIRLLNGETTAERTREWVRLNYRKLAAELAPKSDTDGEQNA